MNRRAPAAPLLFSEMDDGDVFVGVALPVPVDQTFTYRVPARWADRAAPGQRVRVPFRGRSLGGFLVGTEPPPEGRRILAVQELPDDAPLLDDELLRLGRFIARHYGASLGEALAAMVPRGVRRPRLGREVWTVHPGDADAAAAEGPGPRRRVLEALAESPDGLPLADLCRRAGVSESPVKTLERRGAVRLERTRVSADVLASAADAAPGGAARVPTLEPEQQVAVEALDGALEEACFRTFLLLGVTGSGKTEVYLRALATAVAQGRQGIVLVPEIALTPQTVRRFRARFERVAVLHSGMTESERAQAWRRIRRGDVDVVIGPRSAVFAPVPRLGLIVVDEEHEGSFKQQSSPRYHARDIALVRAQHAGAVVVLGSATPALESFHRASEGRHTLLRLPHRIGGRPMPTVQVVDMTSGEERMPGRPHLGRTLQIRIRETLRDGGQVMLLQNRRGFATSVACARCGFVLQCTHCDVAMTYHRAGSRALCHLCGHERACPRVCPDCAHAPLRMQGAGTQTIEDELAALFPDAPAARMDSDSMSHRSAYEEVLDRFDRGEVRILVGTQMIAKGLHFPNVGLVGIVSADTALALPDFRSAERTFSLVAQVAGRAGRGDRPGRVVVQTAMPDHPTIQFAAAHDYEGFAQSELADRKALGYPPWCRLLRVVVRGTDVQAVEARAERTGGLLVDAASGDTEVLGPAEPGVARIQGQWRRHVLVKAPSHREVRVLLDALRDAPRPRRGVEEVWDVDPTSVL